MTVKMLGFLGCFLFGFFAQTRASFEFIEIRETDSYYSYTGDVEQGVLESTYLTSLSTPQKQISSIGSISAAPPPSFRKYKSVTLATELAVIPGLGHLYLGDIRTAFGLFGLASGGVVVDITSPQCQRLGEVVAWNTVFYSVYAGYRDARIYNHDLGFRYKMPTDSLASLVSAPFSSSVLKKPEVWGGLLAAFGGLVMIGLLRSCEVEWNEHAETSRWMSPLAAFPVGIGEEAFFRGFLQSALSESLNPTGGLIVSSLLFGAAHIPNAINFSEESKRCYYTFHIPFFVLLGAYFGWLTQKTGSLRESVAIHAWYDFIIFSLSALTQQAATGRSEFHYAISF